MKIDYIKTIGFRKFNKTFETNLYDVTSITGKNRAGKSNILYAIINIILGTNLSGDEKACLINKHSNLSYGELHFTDNNGIKHIIVRTKNKYSNKANILQLDGKNITQTELMSFYKDKKLFLSIINPLYFLSKKSAEQKEMIDKYLSEIKPKVIFDSLQESQRNALLTKYYNGSKDFKQLSDKEQEDFINLNITHICMDIAYDNLSEKEKKLLEGVPSNIPSYISELNEDIKKTENYISSLDGKIEYAQNIANQELAEYRKFEKDEELTLAQQELSFLTTDNKIVDKENQKKIVGNLEKDILSKETEFNELEKSMKFGKQKYLAIRNGESCSCPTCNQNIQNESKELTIRNMHNELVSMFDKSNLLETQIKDLKLTLSIERCKYHALEGNPTVEHQKRIAVVDETIKNLELEKQEIQNFNNELSIKEKNILGAKIDISKFNTEKCEKLQLIDTLSQVKKIVQKLYISYIEEKMKIAKEYLKNVDIKFYSVLKTTGEIKEDFIITYKNNSLADLSRSETIATALEFANMFNKISNVNFPIFIDDYECCADYDFIKDYSSDTQLLVSKVEKETSLKIADYNSNQYTIIKPIIKGCKTIKTYKNIVKISPAA